MSNKNHALNEEEKNILKGTNLISERRKSVFSIVEAIYFKMDEATGNEDVENKKLKEGFLNSLGKF